MLAPTNGSPEPIMRLTVQVQRTADPYDRDAVGDLARRVLQLTGRVSDIRVERHFIDSAVLSFEDHDRLDSLGEIDRVLEARGLQRV